MVRIMKKTGGRKSRDTLPLVNIGMKWSGDIAIANFQNLIVLRFDDYGNAMVW